MKKIYRYKDYAPLYLTHHPYQFITMVHQNNTIPVCCYFDEKIKTDLNVICREFTNKYRYRCLEMPYIDISKNTKLKSLDFSAIYIASDFNILSDQMEEYIFVDSFDEILYYIYATRIVYAEESYKKSAVNHEEAFQIIVSRLKFIDKLKEFIEDKCFNKLMFRNKTSELFDIAYTRLDYQFKYLKDKCYPHNQIETDIFFDKFKQIADSVNYKYNEEDYSFLKTT